MKVLIFQTGEPLHSDSGDPRPMRAMNLTDSLIEAGHEVVIFSSCFYHQKKLHRTKHFEELKINENLTINLIPSPGYDRNIGLARLIDHGVLAYRLHKVLKSKDFNVPDVAFIGYPPIECAYVFSKWLHKKKVPFMVDAKDQWPHIFLEPFPSFLRPLVKIIFYPYFRMCKKTFGLADSFCSMSEPFIEWMALTANKSTGYHSIVVPLTTSAKNDVQEDIQGTTQWWDERGLKVQHETYISFVGSLSVAFEFTIIFDLAELFEQASLPCKFVICGDGAQRELIAERALRTKNLIYAGWVDKPKIQRLLAHSLAIIAPYRNNDAFKRSVPNKILDGLANELPILTSLDGLTKQLINQHAIGCASENAQELFNYARQLVLKPEFRTEICQNAKQTYENHFEVNSVYGRLAPAITDMVG